jgi:hypothetical protein
MIMVTKSEAPAGPWLSLNSWARSCRMKEGSSSLAARSPIDRSLLAPTAVVGLLADTTQTGPTPARQPPGDTPQHRNAAFAAIGSAPVLAAGMGAVIGCARLC